MTEKICRMTKYEWFVILNVVKDLIVIQYENRDSSLRSEWQRNVSFSLVAHEWLWLIQRLSRQLTHCLPDFLTCLTCLRQLNRLGRELNWLFYVWDSSLAALPLDPLKGKTGANPFRMTKYEWFVILRPNAPGKRAYIVRWHKIPNVKNHEFCFYHRITRIKRIFVFRPAKNESAKSDDDSLIIFSCTILHSKCIW